MSKDKASIVGLMVVDSESGGLGLNARWNERVGSKTVLEWTVSRLMRCEKLDRLVIIHEASMGEPMVEGDVGGGKVVEFHAVEGSVWSDLRQRVIGGRKWVPGSWRGGIGGMTCYDEVVSAKVMRDALGAHDADAGLIVGADWLLVDPVLCDRVIDCHLEIRENRHLVFTQAPPGLCGCVVDEKLLGDLAGSGISLGLMLAYNPRVPQYDPIGRDVCVQIEAAVRNAVLRATYDGARWQRLVKYVFEQVGEERFGEIGNDEVVRLMTECINNDGAALPWWVTVELTGERGVSGVIVPQHHVDLKRGEMDIAVAEKVINEIGEMDDIVLTLGGLGDALMHDKWAQVVETAHKAGVWGIHVETDLLVGEGELRKLLDLPIDVVSVRLNADSAETYEKLMGCDGFNRVLDNIQWLLNERQKSGRGGLPWIVPRMVKTRENVEELDSFFDRWMYFCSHAVVEGATTGCGLMEDQAVINMAPPRRFACRQLSRRMTVHSDGKVALCDQDWLGRAAVGDVRRQTLAEIWGSMDDVRREHREGGYDGMALCGECREWHRP